MLSLIEFIKNANNRKVEIVLIIGGLAFVGYFLWKKYRKPKARIIEPKVEETTMVEEPKTIVLDLRANPRMNKRQKYLESFHKGYDARRESTVAPPMVKIQPIYNDL